MKIEEYLKASPIFALFQAQQASQKYLRESLAEEGVNFLEALLLISLLMEGKNTVMPGELSKSFACSKANISKMLSRLEEDDLIERSISLEDARSFELSLSATGLMKANRLMKLVGSLELSIEKAWGAKKVGNFVAQLDELGQFTS